MRKPADEVCFRTHEPESPPRDVLLPEHLNGAQMLNRGLVRSPHAAAAHMPYNGHLPAHMPYLCMHGRGKCAHLRLLGSQEWPMPEGDSF